MSRAPADTGRLGKFTGSVVAAVFSAVLLGMVGEKWISINAWWFFITTIFAFLMAEGFTIIYNRFTANLSSDMTVPIEFAAFLLVVFWAVEAADWASGQIANAFNSVNLLAYVVFFGLNILPTLGLYFDFLRLRRQRLQASLNS